MNEMPEQLCTTEVSSSMRARPAGETGDDGDGTNVQLDHLVQQYDDGPQVGEVPYGAQLWLAATEQLGGGGTRAAVRGPGLTQDSEQVESHVDRRAAMPSGAARDGDRRRVAREDAKGWPRTDEPAAVDLGRHWPMRDCWIR